MIFIQFAYCFTTSKSLPLKRFYSINTLFGLHDYSCKR